MPPSRNLEPQPAKTILKKQTVTKGNAPSIKMKDSDFSVGSQNKRIPQKVYKFRVDMWCEGCVMDVKQVLEEAKNGNLITDYNIDYSSKKVTVNTLAKGEEVQAILAKSGKYYALEETKMVEMTRTKTK